MRTKNCSSHSKSSPLSALITSKEQSVETDGSEKGFSMMALLLSTQQLNFASECSLLWFVLIWTQCKTKTNADIHSAERASRMSEEIEIFNLQCVLHLFSLQTLSLLLLGFLSGKVKSGIRWQVLDMLVLVHLNQATLLIGSRDVVKVGLSNFECKKARCFESLKCERLQENVLLCIVRGVLQDAETATVSWHAEKGLINAQFTGSNLGDTEADQIDDVLLIKVSLVVHNILLAEGGQGGDISAATCACLGGRIKAASRFTDQIAGGDIKNEVAGAHFVVRHAHINREAFLSSGAAGVTAGDTAR
jgi:hypothetical protein